MGESQSIQSSDNLRESLLEADVNPLTELTKLVKSDFDQVNQIILQELQSEIDLIPQLASHLIQAGGKRIRPVLTLASAQLCQYTGQGHLDLAAAVEFIHSATLLHDDVVDESLMRRGNPSANAVWGNQASVLVGDFLFSRAFQMMVRAGSMDALKSLSDASAVLAEGEVMQLVDAGNLDIVERRYIDIIKAKTATLFESACEVGGIIANVPMDQKQALRTYGSSLGICFQIIDDVLDYASSTRVLGKLVGDDLRDKKVTLPVIHAYISGEADEKLAWEQIFDPDHTVTDMDLIRAQALIAQSESLAYCRDKVMIYAEAAKSSLDIFPDSPLKELMRDLVDFTVNRDY